MSVVISSEKNLYEILGVAPNSTLSTIKSAYRRLVRKYHPDLNNGDETCARKFKEVNEAYEILSDAKKKNQYDTINGFYRQTTSSEAKRKQANSAYRQTQCAEKKQEQRNAETKSRKNSFDFSDVFSDILKEFKNTTSSAKKVFNEKKKEKAPIPINGTDVVSEVSVTLQEAV